MAEQKKEPYSREYLHKLVQQAKQVDIPSGDLRNMDFWKAVKEVNAQSFQLALNALCEQQNLITDQYKRKAKKIQQDYEEFVRKRSASIDFLKQYTEGNNFKPPRITQVNKSHRRNYNKYILTEQPAQNKINKIVKDCVRLLVQVNMDSFINKINDLYANNNHKCLALREYGPDTNTEEEKVEWLADAVYPASLDSTKKYLWEIYIKDSSTGRQISTIDTSRCCTTIKTALVLSFLPKTTKENESRVKIPFYFSFGNNITNNPTASPWTVLYK